MRACCGKTLNKEQRINKGFRAFKILYLNRYEAKQNALVAFWITLTKLLVLGAASYFSHKNSPYSLFKVLVKYCKILN
jgi:hypothetical protein